MKISDVRRERLAQWFADKTLPEREKSYLSQLINGKASFGERAARRLEQDYGMGDMYLDQASLAKSTSYPLAIDEQTSGATSSLPQHVKQGDKVRTLSLATARAERPDIVAIPQYAAAGAMGAGLVLPDQPGIIHNWQVNREWLEKNARNHSGVKNLCIVTGFGDSMRPMFNPGDPLLVDCGIKRADHEGVYFFRIGDEGFVKRLQRIPEAGGISLLAISANKEYRDFRITDDMDFEVLGKVLRVWCGTDF